MQEDFQLIKQAQKGDQLAFEQLVYRYDRQVINIAMSFRNNEDDAKDIYQEVFIRVYRGLKNFQFKSEFSTWLFRITTNVCITHKERKERNMHKSLDEELNNNEEDIRTRGDMIESEISLAKETESNENQKYINDALEQLPVQQKMAFTLKYFDGYKIKEIAEMMQCAEGTVKRYLFNASQKMRSQLKGVIEV
ncbi:MAG: RNA polymerase sigma factor [Ignavibacteriales bacterium]|jgi:RNA polymerase sigma-70 factor (ECF subfamily)|nr:MAG: RNA polymerase sigma factor [Ignavibacteriales bacterium]